VLPTCREQKRNKEAHESSEHSVDLALDERKGSGAVLSPYVRIISLVRWGRLSHLLSVALVHGSIVTGAAVRVLHMNQLYTRIEGEV
jgi:hypothetical protein